jgi:hypothetical protein
MAITLRLVFALILAACISSVVRSETAQARETDIQTQTRNTRCPPPPGAPAGLKNWSCRTSNQNPFTSSTGPTETGDCTPEPDPATQTQLRKTGIEAIDTMAGMGQQADRMLTAMGKAVVAQLAYLSQPNAKIWQDRKEAAQAMGQGIIAYMVNDNASNHDALRKTAEAEAQKILRDPASAIGTTAGNVLMGKAVQSAGGVCMASARNLKAAISARAQAQKAAQRLKAMLDNEERQLAGSGALCSGAGNRVNPQGRRNACVPSTWADEIADETGYPFDESNFRWTDADEVTP